MLEPGSYGDFARAEILARRWGDLGIFYTHSPRSGA